ncbi:hypothetical protein JXI42_08690 [bacterium]|nr:hypothetical protein [bacterium]
MNKKFDCVKMKRNGAEAIRKETGNMTLKKELAYWKEQSDQLRKKKAKVISGKVST